MKYVFIILVVFSNAQTSLAKELLLTSSKVKIHVNQLSFDLIGPKSAIISVQKNKPISNKKFILIKNNKQAFTGLLKPLPTFNKWSKELGERDYFIADFSSFAEPGTYKIEVSTENKKIFSSPINIAKQAQFTQSVESILNYFYNSRNDHRHTWEQDKHIRIFGSQRYVDVSGGWNDAGGDTGKYLSHLSYANYFNPQQLALVSWALNYSYQTLPHIYKEIKLQNKIIDEVFWGADYLVKILDPQGYFYMTVFDRWHTNNSERVVTAYVGKDGDYTKDYQAAFREGAGVAIAALARAYRLSKQTNKTGIYSAKIYLESAQKAFAHLLKNNILYCDNGKENIIDDYTALLAATELFKATKNQLYLKEARKRAYNLNHKITDEGWFLSESKENNIIQRPFYHAAEAGFPIVALVQYLTIEKDQKHILDVKQTIKKNINYQLEVSHQVSNPFNYARQHFKSFQNKTLSSKTYSGFFIPHANETNYWWQGENARLASLSAAITLGLKSIQSNQKPTSESKNSSDALTQLAQNQLDWILGRNPYDICFLAGFGEKNPKGYVGLTMEKGGISNGITGRVDSPIGKGIDYSAKKGWKNWRWVEQWLPHSTWFLIATTALADMDESF